MYLVQVSFTFVQANFKYLLMKGMTTMYDSKWKKWAIAFSAIGLVAMVVERIRPFTIVKKLNVVQHYDIFQWIMLGGLFILIFCKEKYDDERAKAIRLKSFQISFMLTHSMLLSMGLAGTLSNDVSGMGTSSFLFIFSAIGIMSYLLIFYVGLYFDFIWEYDDKGLWENLKNVNRNKWGILVYLAIGTIILLAINIMTYS